jgi:hypothetical protein
MFEIYDFLGCSCDFLDVTVDNSNVAGIELMVCVAQVKMLCCSFLHDSNIATTEFTVNVERFGFVSNT